MTEEAVERLGVPRSYAAFAVPFAATTKMDGCAAIYPGDLGDVRRAIFRRSAARRPTTC